MPELYWLYYLFHQTKLQYIAKDSVNTLIHFLMTSNSLATQAASDSEFTLISARHLNMFRRSTISFALYFPGEVFSSKKSLPYHFGRWTTAALHSNHLLLPLILQSLVYFLCNLEIVLEIATHRNLFAIEEYF